MTSRAILLTKNAVVFGALDLLLLQGEIGPAEIDLRRSVAAQLTAKVAAYNQVVLRECLYAGRNVPVAPLALHHEDAARGNAPLLGVVHGHSPRFYGETKAKASVIVKSCICNAEAA